MGRLGPKAWLIVLGVVAGIGIASAATRDQTAETRAPVTAAPRFCIGARTSSPRAGEAWHPSTLALAIASTPAPERILGALREQLDRGEESAHPLSLGLEEPDADGNDRLQGELWPRVTAAQAWLRPSLEADGFTLVPCDAPTARYALWHGEARNLPLAQARLRHAVWAVAAAAWLRSDDPRALAARLRARSAQPGSAIALVIESQASVEGLAKLADRARKLATLAHRFGRRAPETLGLVRAATGDTVESPIRPGRDEVAVVPRLGALARLEKFEAEVEAQLGPRDDFARRPEGFTQARTSFDEDSDRK